VNAEFANHECWKTASNFDNSAQDYPYYGTLECHIVTLHLYLAIAST